MKLFVVILLILSLPLSAAEPVSREYSVNEDVGLPYSQYPAGGKTLLLWLPNDYGFRKEHKQVASEIAKRGTEVWLVDVHAAYFLATTGGALDKVSTDHLSLLIEHARKTTGKRVIVVTDGRAAILALTALRKWQQQRDKGKYQGKVSSIIMISAQLYVRTPDPGKSGKLMPVVTHSNIPIFILQPAKSPWRWKLFETVPALVSGGSDVYVRVIPDVRDRFYYRHDSVAHERKVAANMPAWILQAGRMLRFYEGKNRATSKTRLAKIKPRVKRERRLAVYRAGSTPELRLKTLGAETVDLKDLKGKVVLVNFWASWCPPCVHEMPSMQRLKDGFKGQPFKILAVNMAESPPVIRKFLDEKVKVNFTVIMDSDGAALHRWKVFAFPTSYVIDKSGKIRYALFGAIEWDNADVIGKINGLLKEPYKAVSK